MSKDADFDALVAHAVRSAEPFLTNIVNDTRLAAAQVTATLALAVAVQNLADSR